MIEKIKFERDKDMKKNGDREEVQKCDVSEILDTFGKYQIVQYSLICLSTMCICMISINYVFVAGDLNYRCSVSECEDENSTEKFPSWWPDTNIDHCSKPVLRSGKEVCTNDSFTGETVACDNWIYENDNTVVAEFNLGCQPWKTNLIGTVHGLGLLISMVVFGWLSDTIGRKPTLVFCVVGGCVGQIKTIVTSYNLYIFIEFIEATISGGNYAAAMILILEITANKYRHITGVVYSSSLHVGESIFAGIAFLVPSWKNVIHIINAPPVFFIVLFFIINESPRWQIVSGKTEEAKKTFLKIAEANKIHIKYEDLENLDEATLKKKFNIGSSEVKEGFVEIFKSKEIIKRVLIMFTCRFTTRMIYNGMMFNSVWLPGDKHLNFLLTVVVSFPGEILTLYILNKTGRKFCLVTGYFACGLLCIVSALIPTTYIWAKLTLFFLSKMIISLCFSGTITYSMELFPTSVRGTLLGLGAFGARLATMLSTITPILNTVSEALPTIFFGGLAILSSALLTLAPETKHLPLFDTIEQLEKYPNDNQKNNKEPATTERYIETADIYA